MDHFIEDLTCSVCFNIFDDPRLLKCSHTFCKNCLESILRSSDSYLWRLSGGRLKCPTCRNLTDLPIGVHSLPVNFALKSIVEKYRTSNRSSPRTCPEHSGKQLNLFCLKDRRLICCHCCEFGQHQDHPTEDLESAYKKERKTACKLLSALQNKNFTGVSATVSALEEQLEECQTIIQEDKKEVVTFFDKIIDSVELKKQNLLSALNDLNQEIVDSFAPKIEEMKQIQDEERDLISLTSATLDEESPHVYLKNIRTIEQGIEMLKKQKLCPIYPVEIHPRFGQKLKHHLLTTSIGDIHKRPIPKFQFYHLNPRSGNKLSLAICVALFLLLLVAMLWLACPDFENPFTALHWSHFLKILEPFLSSCGVQAFTVKSTSQRLACLFHDVTNYLYDLPSRYFSIL
ncbi:tripartite motif-containing protein 59 [Gastrophryne carolinensis]